MNTIIQSLAGMTDMTEQVIATDFLLAAKAGVQNYAVAITQSVTPEVREVLKRQLSDAIKIHEAISEYMISKGYYYTHDPQRQLMVDLDAAEKVMKLQQP
ncbi:spore coat protein [Alkaliphilus serpentinus]|uniref:Spore coat protein n=1 Tax=Alkaliphilus serpentinus TaxID=1482731 RepID=A0A833M967_9FIRM|nr:spore coat protein [Alkaliphilus serpentinus]KAB3529172.1 spore coat protein [Alkaliphilus serpentinus]